MTSSVRGIILIGVLSSLVIQKQAFAATIPSKVLPKPWNEMRTYALKFVYNFNLTQ